MASSFEDNLLFFMSENPEELTTILKNYRNIEKKIRNYYEHEQGSQ